MTLNISRGSSRQHPPLGGNGGFSLVELIMVAGMLVIIMAIALPTLGVNSRIRLNNAARELQQEMQGARLRAVNVNRPLDLRLNCPAAGQYRVVEAGWPDEGRCDQARYPYPPARDAAYKTPPLPRYDGALRQVHPSIALSATVPTLVLRFWPDGSTQRLEGGAVRLISTETIALTVDGTTRRVIVNGLGKIQLQ